MLLHLKCSWSLETAGQEGRGGACTWLAANAAASLRVRHPKPALRLIRPHPPAMQGKREDVARILLGRPDMAADGEEADKFVGLLRMFFAGPGGLRAVDADTCTFMEETLDMLLQHLQSQHPAMCKESEGHGVCLPLLKMLRACPRLPTHACCAARLPTCPRAQPFCFWPLACRRARCPSWPWCCAVSAPD